MVRAGAQKHGSSIQEGEGLGGSVVSLETSHAGGGEHRPHPHLTGHRAGAEHGGGGEGEAAHRSQVTAQGLKGQMCSVKVHFQLDTFIYFYFFISYKT